MSFDSVIFISCFLPVLAILYAIARGKTARNVLLLAAGLIFYAFGSVSGLLLLLVCAAVNYLFGVWLIRTKDGGKGIAAAAVVLDLAFLAAFKYLDFALSALAPVLGGRQISVGLAAPVGISFFTFKCISYIVDTCRDRRSGTRSFFELLLYISFFPQIMAGPITRFTAFRGQLYARTCSTERAAAGLRRFVVGLGKKLILAGAAANVADRAFGPTAVPDARVAWLCAAAYMLQIYFDFSGYSDMAIGLGEVFGFTTPENFDDPYTASSITEFWRRWHISLSLWFRDYLYIPLGGNRKGTLRAAFNKLIVFALCGLWHGAAWTFVLWGVWHGLLAALESLRAIPVKRLQAAWTGRALGHLYTLAAVCLSFVLFRAPTLSAGWRVLGAMFGACPVTASSSAVLQRMLDPFSVALLCAGTALVAAGNLAPVRRLCASSGENRTLRFASFVCCILLLILCIAELSAGSFAPFIYAQF